MHDFQWLPTVIASAGSAIIMIIGGILTDKSGWYRNLNKPSWQPPDWAFGPAWTAIYVLVTWGTVLAWQNAASDIERTILITTFVLNGLLNIGWSLVFFKWHRPDYALAEVVPLWVSTVLLAVVYYQLNPRAGWLIAPYIVWVAFAAYLNRTVMRLNAPFASSVTFGDPHVAARGGS